MTRFVQLPPQKLLDSLVPVVDDAKRLHRPVRQPDDSYIIEVGQNETHEDVVRRHPDVLFIQGDVLFKQAGTGPLTVWRKGR